MSDDQFRIERRLAKFDAELALRGIVDDLPNFIMRERERIAGGRNERISQQHDHYNAQTFNDDADADLDRFLTGGEVRKEAEGCAMLDRVLGEFGHEELRHAVILSWHNYLYNHYDHQGGRRRVSAKGHQSTLVMQDIARQKIADFRERAFHRLVEDISVVVWNGSTVKSKVVKRMRERLMDPAQLSAQDWTAQLSETVARAEQEIAEWQAEQARLKPIHLERKAELERLLTSIGFVVHSHHVLVRCDNFSKSIVELDVRHELAVEFSGVDPPLAVGVSCDGEMFVIENDRVVNITGAQVRPIPGPVDIELFRGHACRGPVWRQEWSGSGSNVSLRWPCRLGNEGMSQLAMLVNNLEAPLRVPVELEMRAARRDTLLRALRAHGLAENRIPLAVVAHRCVVAEVFLTKKEWLRSRATRSALVGDVASAQRNDIFASLPQLAIALIYDWLVDSRATYGARKALATVSDAFALGAAIVEIERLPPKTAFKFPSPKPKRSSVVHRFGGNRRNFVYDRDYFDDDDDDYWDNADFY